MAKMKRNRSADDSDDASEVMTRELPKNKKAKNVFSSSSAKNDKGEPYWELSSSNRRVTISKFGYGKSNNTVRIDIREFYEKDGEHLPGKKGISLSMEQFKALLTLIPSITAALGKEGEDIDVPETDTLQEAKGDAEVSSLSKKTRAKPGKSNIEATSDEEE